MNETYEIWNICSELENTITSFRPVMNHISNKSNESSVVLTSHYIFKNTSIFLCLISKRTKSQVLEPSGAIISVPLNIDPYLCSAKIQIDNVD